ncbi:MAG: hypothetical protein K0R18_141 [Bacillales bacterium]|jgi:hypothetical protein|nr:hypothetical protein [Bacillales bacterium]
MYLVKPNGNYNIVISDIGVTISSNNNILIEKSKIDNSGDARKLIVSNLLLIEDANEKTIKTEDKVEAKADDAKIFVAREEETKVNSEVFVREPKKEVEIVSPVVEEIKNTEVVEISTEEVKVEVAEVVENTKIATKVVAEKAAPTTEVTEKSITKKGKK